MYFTFGFTMIHDENPTQTTVITDKNAHTKTEDAFTTAASKNLFSCRVMAFFIIRFRFHLFSGRVLGRLFQFTENAFACRGNTTGEMRRGNAPGKFFSARHAGKGSFSSARHAGKGSFSSARHIRFSFARHTARNFHIPKFLYYT